MSLQNILVGAVKDHFSKDDDDTAVSHATAQSSSSDNSLFSSALQFIKERNIDKDDIDEEHAVNAHRQYENGEGGNMDSRDLGAGAAMQALKMFNSGSGGESGGQDKNKFIGLAMAQAEKMWEEKAGKGEASGDKQSAINQAAEMAFKFYLKSQMSGSSGTGGPSGLMDLAGKFLK
ncbi:hypothetical protein BDV19DRAFT_394052 [Aspergillus venezuelensis]